MLCTVEQVRDLIAKGETVVLAGEERLLEQLPAGHWIGGTIPYFMTDGGGQTSRHQIFVSRVPSMAKGSRIAVYDQTNIEQVSADSPENGYSVIILPAFSAIHQHYALQAPSFEGLFFKNIAGWVAGVHLEDLQQRIPLALDGRMNSKLSNAAVVLHVELPSSHRAELSLINIFEPGEGDVIEFPATGFTAENCRVNNELCNFVDYFRRKQLDERLPLVGDLCGALVNVSIQALDSKTGIAKFYAPVFEGARYRLARPIADYEKVFAEALQRVTRAPAFSCNCVLNFLYGNLEGKHTGVVTGPMTFGEIAHQLVNQTLVSIVVADQ